VIMVVLIIMMKGLLRLEKKYEMVWLDDVICRASCVG
jgi:hypothetical protein